jgi:hypothetical protein
MQRLTVVSGVISKWLGVSGKTYANTMPFYIRVVCHPGASWNQPLVDVEE